MDKCKLFACNLVNEPRNEPKKLTDSKLLELEFVSLLSNKN